MGWLERLLGKRKATSSDRPLDRVTGNLVLDLRSAEERQMEERAQSRLAEEDEQLAAKLVTLIGRADEEFKRDREAYDATFRDIAGIGEHLCAHGGTERMKLVAYRLQALGGSARQCEFYWDGICGWRY